MTRQSVSERNTPERILIVVLRLAGCVTCTAFLAMFLPVDWMAAAHEWLGLGEFPRTALVDYLTRSIAALYGFHGVLVLLVSGAPVRHHVVVGYLGIMNVLFGVIVLVIDIRAEMPLLWTLAEGPPIMVFGVVILVLLRAAAKPGGSRA
jgi:hypothetical protein